jgi:hypothetical protein
VSKIEVVYKLAPVEGLDNFFDPIILALRKKEMKWL